MCMGANIITLNATPANVAGFTSTCVISFHQTINIMNKLVWIVVRYPNQLIWDQFVEFSLDVFRANEIGFIVFLSLNPKTHNFKKLITQHHLTFYKSFNKYLLTLLVNTKVIKTLHAKSTHPNWSSQPITWPFVILGCSTFTNKLFRVK